jgi:hypothetical protein
MNNPYYILDNSENHKVAVTVKVNNEVNNKVNNKPNNRVNDTEKQKNKNIINNKGMKSKFEENFNDKLQNNKGSISKRVLCYNVLNNKDCNYKNKCMYAHSLSEQKIDTIRHKVYTILKDDNDLSNLNVVNDKKLFETLTQLTKICIQCAKGVCPGGYNCRNGALNQKYRICYEDLMYGNCRRPKCYSIHLTDRNFRPYTEQKNDLRSFQETKEQEQKPIRNIIKKSELMNDEVYKSPWLNMPKSIKIPINDVSESSIDNNIFKKVEKSKYNNINGIKLTEKFFQRSNETISLTESDTIDEDIETIKKYLNDNSDSESDEKSIFEI